MAEAAGGVDRWAVRLAAARDSQSRTRLAFIAATIVAVAITIAEFNSSFSWYTNFAFKQNFATESTVTAEAQKALITEWVKSNRVTISLLGVNFGMSDAPLLGSISLYILSLWFFVCIRRENHLVADLLTDAAANDNREIRTVVFYGIADYLVFTTITNDDQPRDTLGKMTGQQQQLFYLRPSLKLLIFLPAIAVAFIVLSDVFSLFMQAPLRYPHDALWRELLKDPQQIVELVITEGVALVLGTAIFYTCRDIMKFEQATGKVLRTFYEKYIA